MNISGATHRKQCTKLPDNHEVNEKTFSNHIPLATNHSFSSSSGTCEEWNLLNPDWDKTGFLVPTVSDQLYDTWLCYFPIFKTAKWRIKLSWSLRSLWISYLYTSNWPFHSLMCAAERVTFTTGPLNEMSRGQWVPLQFNASDVFKAGLEKAVWEVKRKSGY